MRASLADQERETIITWSDADGDLAHVYTCHAPMVRLLRKHPEARLLAEHRSERGAITGVEYELPVTCLAIFTRRRSSAWDRMLRVGPRRRSLRKRSARGHPSENEEVGS